MAVGIAACDTGSNPSSQQSESARQQKSYVNLVEADPAHVMTYSPTRKTINKWIDTWNKPGQLAFVYMLDNGNKVGYYVFQGPPVSYCASMTPTYKFINPPGDGEAILYQVPAPSLDGVYYSGGQCISYYGIDAATGNYLEFSIGGTQNYILTTQPLDLNVKPLGYTTYDNLRNDNGNWVVK